MNPSEEFAYGGIVFNEEGKVLMRSPSGGWGGYVWTFAKGEADAGDASPEETAIREVREETGYECSIVTEIPGAYESDTCITKYFLMKPTGAVTAYDKETQEVRWFRTDEAFEMIKLTSTAKGRKRDTDALKNAIQTKSSFLDRAGHEPV